MANSARIRVFVSSTIRDLADLRSAIRYWLVELGFEVLLSEFNDFDRRPDSGTFDACFEAIATCDYYLLLVGDRAGSWFEPGVSVTRQEFRVAKALAEAGRIVVVPLVRTRVRAALRATDDEEVSRLLGLPPGAGGIDEARAIRSFVEEIKATDVASPPGGVGGKLWLYDFDEFADVAAALRVTLRASQGVRRQALLAGLLAEMEANFAVLTSNRDGVPLPVTGFLGSVRRMVTVVVRDFVSDSPLERRHAETVSLFSIFGPSAALGLRDAALGKAIRSGEFLEFDPANRRFVASTVLEAMESLAREIDRCRQIAAYLGSEPLAGARERVLAELQAGAPEPRVPGQMLLLLFGLHDAVENTLRLMVALSQWIAGDEAAFVMPPLHPSSPDPSAAAQIGAEEATPALVRAWMGSAAMRDLITGLRSATVEEWHAARRNFPALSFNGPELPIDPNELAEWLAEASAIALRDGEEAAKHWLRQQVRERARCSKHDEKEGIGERNSDEDRI